MIDSDVASGHASGIGCPVKFKVDYGAIFSRDTYKGEIILLEAPSVAILFQIRMVTILGGGDQFHE